MSQKTSKHPKVKYNTSWINVCLRQSPAFWHIATKLFIVAAALFIALFYHRMVLWDQFDFALFLERYFLKTLTFSELLEEHPGHWHTTGYLVMLPMAIFSHWNTAYEVAASFLFSIGIYTLCTTQLMRIFNTWYPSLSAASIYFLSAFFIFSFDQAGNWLWGFQVLTFVNIFGAILCIWSLTQPTLTWRHFGMALFGVLLAIYSFSDGLALLPLGFLLLIAHIQKRPIYIGLWSLFSVAIIVHFYQVIYANHQLVPTEDSFIQLSFSLVVFILKFLGSPITRFAEDLGVPIALLGIGMFIFSSYVLITEKPKKWRLFLPLWAFAAYAVGCAILTAIGRMYWGTDQAYNSHYISFSNWFWLSTFFLSLLVYLKPRGKAEKKIRFINYYNQYVPFILIFLIIMKLGNSVNVAYGNAQKSIYFSQVAKNILAQYPNIDDATINQIYWGDQPEKSRQRLDILYKYRLNIFKDRE